MIGEKREALHSLDVRARERLEQPRGIEQFDAADPPEAYERYEQKVDHVTATKE